MDILTRSLDDRSKKPIPPESVQEEYRTSWHLMDTNQEGSRNYQNAWNKVTKLEEEYNFTDEILRSLRSK